MTTLPKATALEKSIVLLRILIGWHFLYEGITKMYTPNWTSFGYLATAQGPFKSFFTALASEQFINWIDGFNMIALIVVGLTFILGFQEKKGAAIAIILLALYYLAHPPFPGLPQVNVEGNYWFVNKNLIELAACILIFIHPTGHYFGMSRLFAKSTNNKKMEAL